MNPEALTWLIAVSCALGLLSAIPRVSRLVDHVGAWLVGETKIPSADRRLLAFLAVFAIAAVTV